ncbi:ABC transporter substrate-binding protein [Methylophilaceae bacterium]|nr:ABC transporter substrate-binding protein [Methylophilaceae bacterium]
MKKYLIKLFLLIIFFSCNSIAALGPEELVKKTAEDVIFAIKADQEIQKGNKEKIYKLAEEKILPNFDFEKVARLVLGRAWRSASDDQKKGFIIEFRTLLLKTYAVALSKYKDQKIEFKPTRMSDTDEIVIVKSEIIQSGAQPIRVNYALSKSTGKWLVFDIVIEGVSLVTNYRSQFSGVIKKNGMDTLIKRLAKKNKGKK